MADLATLTDLCTPWCVHVAATLHVADEIAAGSTEIRALADAVGADAGALLRVMRHLVSKGVFEEPAAGTFALNEAARGLMGGAVALDLNGIGGRMAHAWSTLLPAVRTGRAAYHEVFGRGFWEDLEVSPDIAASFDDLMGPAGHGIPNPEVLLDSAEWSRIRTVVDVGGGTGTLLAEILRHRPGVHGTLVDLPRVIVRSGDVFRAAGVADRAEAVGQSFFEPLPGGKDLYLLSKVLDDWPDAEAEAILRRCAEAARPSGKVVIRGGVTPEERASPELLMLVLVGGKSRTLPEFTKLAGSAGLEVKASGRSPAGKFTVELLATGS